MLKVNPNLHSFGFRSPVIVTYIIIWAAHQILSKTTYTSETSSYKSISTHHFLRIMPVPSKVYDPCFHLFRWLILANFFVRCYGISLFVLVLVLMISNVQFFICLPNLKAYKTKVIHFRSRVVRVKTISCVFLSRLI